MSGYRRLRTAGEHVFEPVVAFGCLLRDPIGFVRLHAAVPVGLEVEDGAVEGVLFFLAVDEHPDMDDVVTH